MSTQNNFAVEEILVKLNYINQKDLEAARKAAPQGKIVDYLLQQKKITKDLLGQALSEHYKVAYFDLNSASIPKENLYALPPNVATELRAVIVTTSEKELELTTDQPELVPDITAAMQKYFPGKKIKVYYSNSEDIDEMHKVYKESLQARLNKVIESNDVNFAGAMFDEIVNEALDQRSSDIHIEPNIDDVLLRLRVDGLLKEVAAMPHEFYENVLNRIKVLANIRLDEHNRTQDGAIRYDLGNGSILDLRVSIVPILEGQKVVIRVLADYIKNLTLTDLGLNKVNYGLVELATKKTYGMILTTGPTGSGKTTTLYSLIKTLHHPEVNITTIEDPVEYRMPGVNQIQVNKEQEITFARGLRSIVRQDPNIVLVGEIRDFETAEIAVNAALTGHLLLSTFHANDAATAIPRLLDMGIEPFLLASTLSLIIAQRLVRRTCEGCRYSYEYKESEIKELVPSFKDFAILKNGEGRFYKGKGCESCHYTGFKGRIGIFEMIYVTKEIQELIMEHASSMELWEVAKKQGAISFFEDGLEKVALGNVMLEELVRVAPAQIDDKDIYGKKKTK